MSITFRYYTDEDFLKLEELILASYQWGKPIWSFSRHEFCRGVHSAWANVKDNWRHTVGIWEEDGKIISAVICEGVWHGDAFFLFDSLERQKDSKLLEKMFHHAETHLSCFTNDYKEQSRYLHIVIPKEYSCVKNMAKERGYGLSQHTERSLILPFRGDKFDVVLPEGYRIADGNETPDFFLSNTHMFSFNYTLPIAETGEKGFHDLRTMPGYKPELDLCVLDQEGKPVGMAIIWYNEKMPYCELEPLGVVWWSRRKGVARALIYEAANRIMKIAPSCRGMLGGDQQFYWDLGFKVETTYETWDWSRKF
ncbi:GNAT family N-acetyltransferase [Clostridium cellulovorans]|uniref:GCN5-related N-acetyltransferase n=1 Tax=Clostridium cellulovorans (strain ATCC 35296 / DSM 3052 / OCM 3 / 743B) TaxID=573061 RepID=D9SUX9_CLOC7|nr:GNAT family N-acetyltransferase [Clostridium cellulovorans]ADL52954.1 GCN5-related N-acetyltransferase [Clostridium cellulovorans 743B]